MKKNRFLGALCAALALMAAQALAAQDIGLDSQTYAGFSSTDSSRLSISEAVTPWFSLPLGAVGEFTGSGHIGLNYSLDLADAASSLGLPGDLDELKLAFTFASPEEGLNSFGLSLGRFAFRDPTGEILDHAADGMSFSFAYPALKLEFGAGYTGFILNNANRIAMSKADANRQQNDLATDLLAATPPAKPDVFGSPRLIALAELSLPALGAHAVDLGFLMQKDFNPADRLVAAAETAFQPSLGGYLDTQYILVKGTGPLFAGIGYDAWFAYGSGTTLSYAADLGSPTGSSYRYVPITAFAGGARLTYAMPLVLDSAISLRILGASGDANAQGALEGSVMDSSTAFQAITASPLGAVFSPGLSNLVFLELSFNAKPLADQALNAGASLMAFMRPTAGPVAAPGIDPASDNPLLGIELDLYADYGIFSDLAVSLNGGVFIPGGAFPAGSKVQVSVGLGAIIKL